VLGAGLRESVAASADLHIMRHVRLPPPAIQASPGWSGAGEIAANQPRRRRSVHGGMIDRRKEHRRRSCMPRLLDRVESPVPTATVIDWSKVEAQGTMADLSDRGAASRELDHR
jgi:hypothetical protein